MHIKLQHINRFGQLVETKEELKSLLAEYKFDHLTIETGLDNESCSLQD